MLPSRTMFSSDAGRVPAAAGPSAAAPGWPLLAGCTPSTACAAAATCSAGRSAAAAVMVAASLAGGAAACTGTAAASAAAARSLALRSCAGVSSNRLPQLRKHRGAARLPQEHPLHKLRMGLKDVQGPPSCSGQLAKVMALGCTHHLAMARQGCQEGISPPTPAWCTAEAGC